MLWLVDYKKAFNIIGLLVVLEAEEQSRVDYRYNKLIKYISIDIE